LGVLPPWSRVRRLVGIGRIAANARFRLATTIEMERAGRELRRRRDGVRSLDDLVDLANCFRFGQATFIKPLQIHSEIVALLHLVRDLHPQRVLEIGTASGGTLFLFATVAPPDGKLVSVDWEPYRDHPCNPARLRLYRHFAQGRQTIRVLKADTHDTSTVARVKQELEGQVDFLFIDGDHSYEGVARDAELYLPLVRPGGIAAFHDVCPDHARNATGVADWWRDFSRSHAADEIIEDRKQAGYGIGIWRNSD
jgi:predicted O-methyltransferase YrrM